MGTDGCSTRSEFHKRFTMAAFDKDEWTESLFRILSLKYNDNLCILFKSRKEMYKVKLTIIPGSSEWCASSQTFTFTVSDSPMIALISNFGDLQIDLSAPTTPAKWVKLIFFVLSNPKSPN